MTSHAIGIDVIELDRVARLLQRHPERFLARVFTEAEIAFCRGRVPELAARFAAKEATMKALGTGIRGVGWRDIEVLPNRRGKPLLLLHGRGAARAEAIGLTDLDLSLTTARDFAAAVVVGHIGALPEPEREPRRTFRRLASPRGGSALTPGNESALTPDPSPEFGRGEHSMTGLE